MKKTLYTSTILSLMLPIGAVCVPYNYYVNTTSSTFNTFASTSETGSYLDYYEDKTIQTDVKAGAPKQTWAWDHSTDTKENHAKFSLDVSKEFENFDETRKEQITIDANISIDYWNSSKGLQTKNLTKTFEIGQGEVQIDSLQQKVNDDYTTGSVYETTSIDKNNILTTDFKVKEYAVNGGNGNINTASTGTTSISVTNIVVHVPITQFDLGTLGQLDISKVLIVDSNTILDYQVIKQELIDEIANALPSYLINDDDYKILDLTDDVIKQLLDFDNTNENTVYLNLQSIENSRAVGATTVKLNVIKRTDISTLHLTDLTLNSSNANELKMQIEDYVNEQMIRNKINPNSVTTNIDDSIINQLLVEDESNLIDDNYVNKVVVTLNGNGNDVINSSYFNVTNKINVTPIVEPIDLGIYDQSKIHVSSSNKTNFSNYQEQDFLNYLAKQLNIDAQLTLNKNIVVNNSQQAIDQAIKFSNNQIESFDVSITGFDDLTGTANIIVVNDNFDQNNDNHNDKKTFYNQPYFWIIISFGTLGVGLIAYFITNYIKKKRISKNR